MPTTPTVHPDCPEKAALKALYLGWAIAAVYAAAHLLPMLIQPGKCWSVATLFYTEWSYAAPGLVLIGASVLMALVPWLAGEGLLGRQVPTWVLSTVGALLLGATCLYTVGHNFWGDGGLAEKYASASFVPKSGLTEPGIVGLIHWLAGLCGWSVSSTYRLLSLAGGALFLAGWLLLVLRRIGRTYAGLGVLLFACLQVTSIFFMGYVETYSLLTGVFVLYLSLVVCSEGWRWRWTVLVAVHAALVALHPLFIVFLPALLCLPIQRRWGNARTLVALGGVAVLGLTAHLILSLVRGGPGLSGALLPLLGHTKQVYGMFSAGHLLDVTNLAAAALVPAIAAIVMAGRRAGPLSAYVLIAVGCALFFDFKLGAMDGDVFAVCCLPIAMLGALCVGRIATSMRFGPAALALLLGLSLLHFVPWLALNRTSALAAPFVYEVAGSDAHQQLPNRRKSLGLRFLAAGQSNLYMAMTGQREGAMDTTNVETQNNYAVMLMREGRDDDALAIFRSITAQAPAFALPYYGIAQIFDRRHGALDSAARYYEQAWQLDSGLVNALLALARCEALAGKREAGRSHLEQYVDRQPRDANALAQLARLRLTAGDTAGARACVARAVRLPMDQTSQATACAVVRALDRAATLLPCEQALKRAGSWGR